MSHVKSQTPAFDWGFNIGGTSDDEYTALQVDNAGNVYVAGIYNGTVDLDPGSGTSSSTSNGFKDMFIQKFDPNGNLIWVKTIGGKLGQTVSDMVLDGAGNMVLVGQFADTVDFDPGAGVHFETANWITGSTWHSTSFSYFLKLDTAGNFKWVKTIQGDRSEGLGVAVDGSDNIYISGYFTGTVDADPGSGTDSIKSNGQEDIYVLKLTPSGSYTWGKALGGPKVGSANQQEFGSDICVGPSGNVYVTGRFTNNCDFDPGPGTFIRSGTDGDAFVLKLDAGGNFIWAAPIGGNGQDEAHSIMSDASGNLYVEGTFQDKVDFDPSSALDTVTGTPDGGNVFIQKFDSSGNHQWVYTIRGTVSQGYTLGSVFSSYMAYDGNADLFVTGQYYYSIDFNPGGSLGQRVASKLYDVFILQIDKNGNYKKVNTLESTDEANGYKIVASSNGVVYVAGMFNDTIDLDPDPTIVSKNSSGMKDAFLIKLKHMAVGVSEVVQNTTKVDAYPNPTKGSLSVDFPARGNFIIKVYDMLGRIESETHVINDNHANLLIKGNPGVYFVKILNSTGKTMSVCKVIKR